MRCREILSGGSYCSDKTKCADPLTNFYECSDLDVAARAGNTCSGWPFYNGGYPLNSLHWDEEDEFYECARPHASGNFCERWISIENGIDEWEVGAFQCDRIECTNGVGLGDPACKAYCKAWSGDQIEVNKCANSVIPNSRLSERGSSFNNFSAFADGERRGLDQFGG